MKAIIETSQYISIIHTGKLWLKKNTVNKMITLDRDFDGTFENFSTSTKNLDLLLTELS